MLVIWMLNAISFHLNAMPWHCIALHCGHCLLTLFVHCLKYWINKRFICFSLALPFKESFNALSKSIIHLISAFTAYKNCVASFSTLFPFLIFHSMWHSESMSFHYKWNKCCIALWWICCKQLIWFEYVS